MPWAIKTTLFCETCRTDFTQHHDEGTEPNPVCLKCRAAEQATVFTLPPGYTPSPPMGRSAEEQEAVMANAPKPPPSPHLTQPPPQPGRQDVSQFILDELGAFRAKCVEGGWKWPLSVLDEILTRLAQRRAHGLAKYGTSLMTWNGRDPLADAMEEEYDRLQYLVQARLERKEMLERIDALEYVTRSLIGVVKNLAPYPPEVVEGVVAIVGLAQDTVDKKVGS